MFAFRWNNLFVLFNVGKKVDGSEEMIFAELLETRRFVVVEKSVKNGVNIIILFGLFLLFEGDWLEKVGLGSALDQHLFFINFIGSYELF